MLVESTQVWQILPLTQEDYPKRIEAKSMCKSEFAASLEQNQVTNGAIPSKTFSEWNIIMTATAMWQHSNMAKVKFPNLNVCLLQTTVNKQPSLLQGWWFEGIWRRNIIEKLSRRHVWRESFDCQRNQNERTFPCIHNYWYNPHVRPSTYSH